MELDDSNRTEKMIRARKRVDELKGFYIHLTVFILVNIFITTMVIVARMNGGDSFGEALFSFGSFSTAIFWGIGLAFHAAKVFGYNPFFSKDWEKRQIQKYMDKDKKEAEKYQ